jgi:DNA-binding IclR family transcriptional regulator
MSEVDDLEEDSRKGVQSVEIASRFLDVLADHPDSMMLKNLAAGVGISTSRAHSYLVSLIRAGLVEQDPVNGRYGLGHKARKIGLSALSRLDVNRVASDAVSALRAETLLTVSLCVWSERGPMVVRWERGEQPLTLNVNIGSTLPLLTTAVGQVFLAYLPAQQTKRLALSELKALSDLKSEIQLRSESDVREVVARVRRDGFGRMDGGLLADVSAVGAGIFDNDGKLVAAIGLLGPSVRSARRASQSPIKELLAATKAASMNLGAVDL